MNVVKKNIIPFLIWSVHSETDCVTCARLIKQAKGGRPPKRAKIGRLKLVLVEEKDKLKYISTLESESKTIPPQIERFVSYVIVSLK